MEDTAHAFDKVSLEKLLNEGESDSDVAESQLCDRNWTTYLAGPLDSADFWEMRQRPTAKGLRGRFRYCPVQEGYGTPIHHVTDFVLLLKALRNAIAAHQEAYVNMNILHRDIGIHNIFYPKASNNLCKGEAYGNLIDFDLSMKTDGTSNRHMTNYQTVFLANELLYCRAHFSFFPLMIGHACVSLCWHSSSHCQ
ncbi:hypothetical protein CVT24_002289 [Panaeolus cyanescens]|uniref:Fungal-type protein kinase domain-containing protein n=1 Tax=Panaeolus cyanescens TaxID=181874 RepID=A0A409YIS1_9AGAR|nr:hypothetical protein CVT24_002289 [Panaeolus cyanescens]